MRALHFSCEVKLQVALKLLNVSKGSVLPAEELELGNHGRCLFIFVAANYHQPVV